LVTTPDNEFGLGAAIRTMPPGLSESKKPVSAA
jgi:hypothetical protein